MRQMIVLTLLLGACGAPEEAFDAEVDADDGAVSVLDGGFDAGLTGLDANLSDANLSDAGVDAALADAGVDAGTVACPASAVLDPVTSRCIYRMAYTSGALCPGSMEPLYWGNIDDQHRIQALVRPLGNGGTGLVRSTSLGWIFREAGTPPGGIDWAPGQPSGAEQYSYMGADGLRSYFRAYAWQFCLGPAL